MIAPCVSRVLVVENDLQTRGQLLEILTRPGYNVRAADGQGYSLVDDAKSIAVSFRPHVVVMDLRLLDEGYGADRSGLELLKEECFSSSRCILHSAYLNYDHRVTRDALIEARVADVVGKEESPRRLISAVEKAARDGCICRRKSSIEWPPAWDQERVAKTLFGENTDIPSDIVTDILGHLFPESSSVRLKSLKDTDRSPVSVFRGRSVLFQVWPDDMEPFVVKLAPRDRTDKEVIAYNENIRNRLLGRFYAQLEAHKIFWELGGICYSFIGSSLKAMDTFSDFYHQQDKPDEIIKPLSHYFEEVWSRHYSDSKQVQTGSLYAAYDSFLKLSQRLDGISDHQEMITIDGLPGLYLNPFRWIIEHKTDSFISNAKQAITHGDLHGDNLFVEEEHAWAIDFERSKHGPILRDFVELEVDIVTRLVRLPSKDLQSFKGFVMLLCTPVTPTAAFLMPVDEQNKEFLKGLEVIQALRVMAQKVTGYQDVREYYWGLLLDTAFSVFSAEIESEKRWRGLAFASILCERLSHWGSDWPPKDHRE